MDVIVDIAEQEFVLIDVFEIGADRHAVHQPLIALLILVFWFSSLTKRFLFNRFLTKSGLDRSLQYAIAQIVSNVVLIVGILVVLDNTGIHLGALATRPYPQIALSPPVVSIRPPLRIDVQRRPLSAYAEVVR